jgi:hypothetical protein
MDQLADHPEDAEPKKYSHERWQVSDGLEGWYCDQEHRGAAARLMARMDELRLMR